MRNLFVKINRFLFVLTWILPTQQDQKSGLIRRTVLQRDTKPDLQGRIKSEWKIWCSEQWAHLSQPAAIYTPPSPSPDWLFFPDTTGTPAPHARPSLTGLIRTDPCNYLAVTAVELARPTAPTRQKYTTGSKERLETVNSQPEDEFSFSLSFLIFLQVWSHKIPTSVPSTFSAAFYTFSSFCCSKLVFKGTILIHECNWNLCFAPL